MVIFGARISTIQLAFALSLALHALALIGWDLKLPFDQGKFGKQDGALAVRLVPLEGAPPVQRSEPLRLPVPVEPRRKKATVPLASAAAPAAPVLALERPSPPVVSVTPAPAVTPAPTVTPAPAALGQDFAAFVEARRRARQPEPAPQPPAETEQERHNRIVAQNLGLGAIPSFGSERVGGGLFEIWRVTRDEAEFGFYGWNKTIGRNSMQMIEVQRGTNPTIELAVVRRMIALIRERTTGELKWESKRLGRDVTLSANPADNAKLEEFLLQEFFSAAAARRR